MNPFVSIGGLGFLIGELLLSMHFFKIDVDLGYSDNFHHFS